jgi:hypothetical protein
MIPKNNEQNLGDSLLESVAQAGAIDIASDVSEMALDSLLEEGLLKDVPVFGWMAKLYAVTRTVRDRIFLKKVASFLFGTKSASQGAKDEFRARIEGDPEFRREVGENLVLLLERHDHFEKSKLLGKVFAAQISGDIDYDTFLRIATAIDRAPIADLRRLPDYKKRLDSYDGKSGESFVNALSGDTCQSLYTSGLVSSGSAFEVTYHSNEIMALLVKLITQA